MFYAGKAYALRPLPGLLVSKGTLVLFLENLNWVEIFRTSDLLSFLNCLPSFFTEFLYRFCACRVFGHPIKQKVYTENNKNYL